MMTDLFPNLGRPTMKSIEISPNSWWNQEWFECSWSFDCFSLIELIGITFNNKGVDVMFHTFLEKQMFDLFIGFGKP
jgi:hypothetical protein